MTGASNALTIRWASTIDDTSTVLSAAGVVPLLALLAASADGPARAELSAFAGAEQPVRSPATRFAIGAWTRRELPLTDWWREHTPASMRGTLTGDLRADKIALDAWAGEQTDGLIPHLPIVLNDEIRLVLASALTVKTGWAEPFEDTPLEASHGPWHGTLAGLTQSGTDLDALSVADTEAGPVTLVTVRGRDDVDVVLALGDPDRGAGAVLPAAITALDSTSPRVTGSRLADDTAAPGIAVGTAWSYGTDPLLHVSTVRFEVAADHDLLAHKALFGLTAASDPHHGTPHFPLISPQFLYVQRAKQSAVATFSAHGFEAAAVTSLGFAVTSAPGNEVRCVSVRFDRPFGFVAVHRPTGLVLVAGWVADPEPYQDARNAAQGS